MSRIITYVCDICGKHFSEGGGICVATYYAHHNYDFCNDCKGTGKVREFIDNAEMDAWVGGAKDE